MPLASLILVLLGLLLVAALAGLAIQTTRLGRARARIEELETVEDAVALASSRSPRAVQAAGFAVRTVMETASRVRTEGVRGMLLSSIDDLTTWALEDRSEIVRIADADGTVTIFFSDIENSTSVNSDLGDEAWVRLLGAHDRLLQTYIDKHRGHVVKNQGDGYMVVFSTPELALGCALDVQRALRAKRQRNRHLRRTPIRVRIGLHTGTAIERDGDYFGRNVAMAARVASMADGGEILVSSELAERLGESSGYDLTETEPVNLKGLPGEHVLWIVDAA
ncbi:MAG: adenylate/guanylate cyclase domain-containing protein [Marmoricola sp.]